MIVVVSYSVVGDSVVVGGGVVIVVVAPFPVGCLLCLL